VGPDDVITFIDSKRGERSIETRWLIIYCLVVASTDVLKILLLGSSVEVVAALGYLFNSLTTPATLWLDLLNSSRFYLGGYLTNVPLLTLAAVGLARAREPRCFESHFMRF